MKPFFSTLKIFGLGKFSLLLFCSIFLFLPTTISAAAPLVFAHADKLLATEQFTQAYDLLWQAIQDNPEDIKGNILLARAATKLKLYDQAAAAYERILIIDPNHIKARLNLGIAFYRLEAYTLAENELNKLASSESSNPFTLKAQDYLNQIRQKKSSHQWRGALSLGYIYDSNVNTAPDEDFIDSVDGSYPLSKDTREISDWGITAGLKLSHDWDFGERGGFGWKNSLEINNYIYNDESDSNINMFSLASGLVYSEKNYFKLLLPLTFEYLDYGSEPFFRTFGVMPRLDLYHTDWFLTRLYATLQYQNYNWDKRRDGTYGYLGVMPRFYWVDGKYMLQWRLGYEYKWAREDFKAFQGPRSELQFLTRFNNWLRYSLLFEYRTRRYDERDPYYPKTRDEDRYKIETKFTLLLPWQLRTNLSFDYTSKDANLKAYSFRRKRAMIKLEKRF
ncbi:MAG: surface lipoprotein assembly modifier [Pseudomonadota bacterium]|nr:surface lipoprotein assembly modifier [Pseudomonadota bacterium]